MTRRLLHELPFRHVPRGDKRLLGYLLFVQPVRRVRTGTVELRVLDVYEDSMSLTWRYTPDWPVFLDHLQLELEMERACFVPLPESLPYGARWGPEENVAGRKLLASLLVRDDPGTTYQQEVTSYGGSSGPLVRIDGRAMFLPSLPPHATRLTVTALGAEFVADLAHDA